RKRERERKRWWRRGSTASIALESLPLLVRLTMAIKVKMTGGRTTAPNCTTRHHGLEAAFALLPFPPHVPLPPTGLLSVQQLDPLEQNQTRRLASGRQRHRPGFGSKLGLRRGRQQRRQPVGQ